jgi:hypothetical protein
MRLIVFAVMTFHYIKGTVQSLGDNIATIYNCDVKVKWESEGFIKKYRVGREKGIGIRFTKPAKVEYVQDHLPAITKGMFL